MVDFDELEPVVESGFSVASQLFDGQPPRAVVAADAALRRLSLGALDLRSGLFLALLAAGTYEFLRGNIRAPALSLFWYAGEMLRLKDGVPGAPGKAAGGD